MNSRHSVVDCNSCSDNFGSKVALIMIVLIVVVLLEVVVVVVVVVVEVVVVVAVVSAAPRSRANLQTVAWSDSRHVDL